MTPRTLSQAERRSWLRLARTRRVGLVTFRDLITRYETPDAALEALPRLARRAGAKAPKIPTLAAINAERAAVAELGGRIIASCEPDFPELLRALDPPPPVLTVIGSLALLCEPTVAIVGARNASAIGRRFAREIAAEVGEAGYVIVSGLARGVDTAAHNGALGTGTAAVVAGGPDQVTPPENADLHRRIAAEGAIVSENPVGQPPTPRDFPRRNRLISGLSLGVVVIEAAARSGSLITARYAAEQGREVMAAPGSPLDPRARGTNALIRDGAALIESAADVLEVVRGARPRRALEPDAPAFAGAPADETALERAAEEVRAQVRELLSPSPVARDDLVRETGASAAAVSAALMELELAGEALQLPGGLVTAAWPEADGG
ncbi:MAG: DNA-processing protein DprA [Caulobacterales bacterium]|nr:DNA-processing protein DprA [Caulobacterales bacterium]